MEKMELIKARDRESEIKSGLRIIVKELDVLGRLTQEYKIASCNLNKLGFSFRDRRRRKQLRRRKDILMASMKRISEELNEKRRWLK